MTQERIALYSSAALDRLGQLGASLVGLSAFAYIAGYFKLKHSYSVIGAEWVISFLSGEDILRAGLGPMALFGLSILSCVIMVGSGALVKTKIATFLVLIAIVLFVLRGGDQVASPDLPTVLSEYNFSYAIANFLYAASGALLVYCVYKFIFVGLNGATSILFVGALMMGLYAAPVYLGHSWGKAAIANDPSFLPWVKNANEKGSGWRLIGNVNGKYLLMSNRTGLGDTYFQLVEIGPDWKVIAATSFNRSEGE